VQTGVMMQYPYYNKHPLLRAELENFKPTWDYNFDEFDRMALELNNEDKPRTNNFVKECKALQKKVHKKQLEANQVSKFRELMEDFFTKSDRGFERFYGNPDRDVHDKPLWILAKAAVALYEHCKWILDNSAADVLSCKRR
jgi:hypothetical protein